MGFWGRFGKVAARVGIDLGIPIVTQTVPGVQVAMNVMEEIVRISKTAGDVEAAIIVALQTLEVEATRERVQTLVGIVREIQQGPKI